MDTGASMGERWGRSDARAKGKCYGPMGGGGGEKRKDVANRRGRANGERRGGIKKVTNIIPGVEKSWEEKRSTQGGFLVNRREPRGDENIEAHWGGGD